MTAPDRPYRVICDPLECPTEVGTFRTRRDAEVHVETFARTCGAEHRIEGPSEHEVDVHDEIDEDGFGTEKLRWYASCMKSGCDWESRGSVSKADALEAASQHENETED